MNLLFHNGVKPYRRFIDIIWRASLQSRACPDDFPHRNVCRLQCGNNGDAFKVPDSKLVEPVQNIKSFLQNIPKGKRVARFVEQDMPSCQKFFGFHLILLAFRAESMFVLPILSLLVFSLTIPSLFVVMSCLNMSI